MYLEQIPWKSRGLVVVVDYETSGLHADDGARPSTVGVKWGDSDSEQLAIPIDQGNLDKEGTNPTLFGDAPNVDIEQWTALHEWFSAQRLVMHNAKADMWFAWAGLREDPECRFDLSHRLIWDTMIVESLLEPGNRVGLDYAAERLGINAPYRDIDASMKKWAKKNKLDGAIRYDLAPWDLLEPYLLADLERTWEVYWSQIERVRQGEIPKALVQREVEFACCLFDMERVGLPYNVIASLRAADEAKTEMQILKKRMTFDPSNRESVANWLRANEVRLFLTEKGDPQIDQAAIGRAIEQAVPHAEDYQRWTKLQTAASLWYSGWAERAGIDWRVRADYRQVKTFEGNSSSGTVSGRLAVSRVQVQAIPGRRQIPEGYPAMQDLIAGDATVWEADISQAEMRTVAVLAECEPMLDGFRQGFDAHDSTTRLIWGIEKDDPEWDARRQVAKRLGFGVIYGAGIKTLAAQILQFTGEDLGEDGVRSLWDQYRSAFPQLFSYSKKMQSQVDRTGFLVLPGGKRRVFQEWEYSYKAMNAVIQGSVSVGMLTAMLAIRREYPGIMVGQVHDSVILETNSERWAMEAGDLISEAFEEWFPGCPFPVEVKPYADK